MDGIGLSHHHMTHVIAVEIEWGAFVEKKDPLRFNVATCNWSCVDNWVILIFLLFFFWPVRVVEKGLSGHGKTWPYEHQRLKKKNVFFFTKINVHWIIEWVELSNGVAPSNSWRWSVKRNLVCSMPKWEDGDRVWRMACCQPRCLETDPVESFRCLRF